MNNKTIEAIKDYIREADEDEQLYIIRDINSYNGALEYLAWEYFDEEFFKIFFSDPIEAARATYFGNIQNWNDKYIRFNAYGNLESTYFINLDESDIDEIIGAIESVPYQYLPDDIQNIIDENKDEEDNEQ